jgi:hypothetical protein
MRPHASKIQIAELTGKVNKMKPPILVALLVLAMLVGLGVIFAVM